MENTKTMENMIDTENRQQVMAFELIANTNSSFFLTGRAGTGKTTFLRKVQQMVDKQFITLAPTGVAAILAGGDTIHSFLHTRHNGEDERGSHPDASSHRHYHYR